MGQWRMVRLLPGLPRPLLSRRRLEGDVAHDKTPYELRPHPPPRARAGQAGRPLNDFNTGRPDFAGSPSDEDLISEQAEARGWDITAEIASLDNTGAAFGSFHPAWLVVTPPGPAPQVLADQIAEDAAEDATTDGNVRPRDTDLLVSGPLALADSPTPFSVDGGQQEGVMKRLNQAGAIAAPDGVSGSPGATAGSSDPELPTLAEQEEPQWDDECHDPRINWNVYLNMMGGELAIRGDELTC